MSGILFSKDEVSGLGLGQSSALGFFANRLALRSSSARLDLFASSIAFGLALGQSSALLTLAHV